MVKIFVYLGEMYWVDFFFSEVLFYVLDIDVVW